jgi:ABC-2 type transport system permease protein
MLRYLNLEIRRMFRDTRFVFFTMAVPVAFYLLWSNIFKSSGTDPLSHLSVAAGVMVSMASYGAIGAAMSTTGPRLAQERKTGWLRQLQVTPLPARTVIIGKTIASMTLALPAILLVGLTAVITKGVQLSAGQWVGMIAVMWLATLPFAALGTMIGSLVGPNSAQPLTLGLYMTLSIIGGLWMPVSILPKVLQTISSWTPSNRFAELGQDIVRGQTPSATAGLVLAAWTLVLGTLAVLAYRRATVRT